jgi:hypothetical protein
MKARELQTAGEVIDKLGGTAATARLTDRKVQHVSNWRAAGKLPAKTFLILKKELAARGLTAPAALWGINEPERAA